MSENPNSLQWSFPLEWQKIAIAEGWNVFDSSDYGLQIERIDDPEDGSEPKFEGDEAAVDFVRRRAREGSRMHRMTLEFLGMPLREPPNEAKLRVVERDPQARIAELLASACFYERKYREVKAQLEAKTLREDRAKYGVYS